MGLKQNIAIEKSANLFVFSMQKFDRYIFLHNATQGFQNYLISMSKLHGFKYSLIWRWEQVFNSMPLISTICQVKTWKSSNEFSKSGQPVFILMPFWNGWSQEAIIYREYPAKCHQRKRHISASKRDNQILKKVLKSFCKPILWDTKKK